MEYSPPQHPPAPATNDPMTYKNQAQSTQNHHQHHGGTHHGWLVGCAGHCGGYYGAEHGVVCTVGGGVVRGGPCITTQ